MLALFVTNIRAKFPTARHEAETVSTFIVKPDAFMQRLIFLLPKRLLPVKRTFKFIIRPSGLNFRPAVPYFWAGPRDSW